MVSYLNSYLIIIYTSVRVLTIDVTITNGERYRLILPLNKKEFLDKCRDLDTLQELSKETLKKELSNQKLTNNKKTKIRTIYDLSRKEL